MSKNSRYVDDTPAINVVQVVALNVVAFGAVLLTAKGLGATWLSAFLSAWIGGSVLTVLVAGALVALASRRGGSGVSVAHRNADPTWQSAPLVAATVTDTMQVWEEDRLAELDFALASGKANTARRPRRETPAEMVRVWDEDADADFVAPRRPVRRDRRQHKDLDFIGQERRVQQR